MGEILKGEHSMSFLTSKKIKIVFSLIIISVVPFIIFSLYEPKILKMDPNERDKVLLPFGYFMYTELEEDVRLARENATKGVYRHPNPWMETYNFVASLREYSINKEVNIEGTLKQIDTLIEHFVKSGYKFPRPKYQHYEEGWVSCMDAPPVAVCCQLAWEITGDDKYKKYRDILILHAIKKPTEPTFIITFPGEKGDKTWLSEYASLDPEERKEKEYYVLNGFLIGLHSIKILSHTTSDKELEKLYQSSLAKYKELASSFYYKNGEWTWYMLTPPSINQLHYLVFEMVELEALYALTKDPFYLKEAENRRKILSKVLYPRFQIENDKIKWGILRACAPHPYYIDTYPMEIRFYDAESKLLTTFKSEDTTFVASALMSGIVPMGSRRFDVYADPSNKGDGYVKYFSGSIPENEKIEMAPEVIKLQNLSYDLRYSYDAELTSANDGRVTWTDQKEARITFDFHELLPININTYWGLPIYSHEETTVRIFLFDDQDKAAHRYYLPLKKGNNFILLHYLGFRNLEDINLQKINRMEIRLYERSNTQDSFLVAPEHFYILKNPFEVSKFLHLYPYINKSSPFLRME